MKKINLLIAALHAGAMALAVAPGAARAQDSQEIRAYMNALSSGTADAMAQFLSLYPNSALPGSAIGASIAAGVDQPTAAVGAGSDSGKSSDAGTSREGLGNGDDHPGIY